MIIDDLDVAGTVHIPDETNAPLIVDSNTVLALSASLESFESVARWYAKVVQDNRPLKMPQLSERRPLDIDPSGNANS